MTRRTRLAAAAIGVAVIGIAVAIAMSNWTPRNDRSNDPNAGVKSDSAVADEATARELLRQNPRDPSALLKLTNALRRQGRFSEAELTLTQAIQCGLSEKDGRREAALLLARTDWPPEVEGLMKSALRERPDDVELTQAIARSYAAKGRWLEAELLYSRLIETDSRQSEWRYQRGVASMRAAHFSQAIEDLRFVLSIDSTRYDARLYLGHSLLGDARMIEAETELRHCRKLDPAAVEPIIGLAKCAIERDDLDSAESLLAEASRLDQRSVLVLQEVAGLALRRGQSNRAIDALNRVIEIDPRNRQAHLQISQAYLAAGNFEKSKQHEKTYQELDRQEEARLSASRGVR
jgi:tetratricopeptide (TPR) repeat protein